METSEIAAIVTKKIASYIPRFFISISPLHFPSYSSFRREASNRFAVTDVSLSSNQLITLLGIKISGTIFHGTNEAHCRRMNCASIPTMVLENQVLKPKLNLYIRGGLGISEPASMAATPMLEIYRELIAKTWRGRCRYRLFSTLNKRRKHTTAKLSDKTFPAQDKTESLLIGGLESVARTYTPLPNH
jgi:hypothetical protein